MALFLLKMNIHDYRNIHMSPWEETSFSIAGLLVILHGWPKADFSQSE